LLSPLTDQIFDPCYTKKFPYQAILIDVRRLITTKFNGDEKQL